MENLKVPDIYNTVEKRLKPVSPDILIASNTFDIFNNHLQLCINTIAGTEGLPSVNRSVLYQLVRMGFEVQNEQTTGMTYGYYLQFDHRGVFYREESQRPILKPFNANTFSSNFDKVAYYLSNRKFSDTEVPEREQLFRSFGLIDSKGKYSRQYNYLKEFFEKEVDSKPVQSNTFKRSAFTLIASKAFPNAKPGEIADMYNTHKNSRMARFGRMLSNWYSKITSSPIGNNDIKDLEHQYVTSVQNNAKCLTNGRTIEQLMRPGISIDEQASPVAYPCTHCPLYNQQEGVACGVVAIGAREANRWNLEVVKHESNGKKVSGAALIVDKLIEGGFISQY
jgi:hypothetical protein